MADKIFEVPLLNPIRFVQDKAYVPGRYFTKHFDDALQSDLLTDDDEEVIYFQKYTLLDNPVIQLFSDYSVITCKLFDKNGSYVRDYTVTLVSADISGETYKCYEIELSFASEGYYYLQLSYTNDDTVIVDYFSEPIYVRSIHEGTILIEGTNSSNDFFCIFTNGWVSIIRVEGKIINFKAKSVDTVYDDEIHSTTLVASTPYREFTLALGGVTENASQPFIGIPDWMLDKVNRHTSLDQVKYDGKYFCKSEGAQWEEVRFENYPFSGQSIFITESENKFQLEFDSSSLLEDMAYNYRVIPYPNQSSDVAIVNVFKDSTSIEKILFKNVGGAFDVTIATETTGGDDDFSITRTITKRSNTLDIGQFFIENKIVNVTGITASGSTVNMFICWLKLDAPKSGTSNPYYNLGVGAIVHYKEQNSGDFDLNFDDGLGREDTAWIGWAVCDGRRGTDDWNSGDTFMLPCSGLDITRPAGSTGGANIIKMTRNMLPRIWFAIFGDSKTQPGTNTGNNNNLEPYVRLSDDTQTVASMGGLVGYDQYRASKSAATIASIGKTNTIGGNNGDGTGDPAADTPQLPTMPKYRRVIVLQKISE